jgi:FAD/FMN-containing dehydrogenase/Fe-S oxidoreductase
MFEELKKIFSGEIFSGDQGVDAAMRTIYSTDASEYQERPIGVAIPKTVSDLQELVKFATENNITLIPRAAGTSLAGQVVGSGLVVDISVHFNQILELNVEEKWVRVQPGVIRDDLNAYLKPFGLLFGPETSTANRAMIGGMIGNNSCGLHSIIWGNTRDHLQEAKVILSDGKEVCFHKATRDEWNKKSEQDNAEGQIYHALGTLLGDTENRKNIAEGFPRKDIKRRNTGYALDILSNALEAKENLNICQLIAGAEGTLCIITEAKLQLIDLPPAHVGMVAVHTQSIQDAMMANIVALDHQCSASELVDDFILQFTVSHPDLSAKRSFIEGAPKAILMVEFFAEDQHTLIQRCEALATALKEKNLGYAWPILQGEACQSAWEVRKAGLGLLRNLPGDARPVNLIEDCAVHPQDLPNYIADLEKLLQRHGVQYSMYAHAGAGELHVEPILNLKTAEGVKLFRQILSDTVLLVKTYRGSLSGEHGDGRLRGEFIPQVMGEKVYALFREVKQIFDPNGIFNKGKIVDTPAMDSHLRYGFNSQSLTETKTVFDFSAQEGYLKLTEKCSGSGDCRKSHISGGTMCPSYMATRNEKDTTRARANVLRQYLTGDQSNRIDREEVKEIMDLCLSCKACKTECPSSVDVSKLKGEFMQSYYDVKGVPFRTNIIARFSQQMKLASQLAGIYNAMVSTPTIRKTMNKMVGFHPKRSLPLVANETLWKWYQKRKKSSQVKRNGNTNGSVYLFCDEFTNYQDAEIGKKAVLLIEALGYEVLMVKHPDSARTYLSKGLIREAKKLVNEQIKIFGGLINEELPLVGIEPSAILGFRDEFLSLVDPSLKTSAARIAKQAFLFEEWFMQEVDKGKISKDVFTNEKKKLKIHGHCHQKSIASMTPTKRALSFPENFEARLIPSGCCGMAGSFGYEAEHYDVSMNIGELVLFKSVRELDEEVEVAASGTSCRHQIKDGTGRKSFHPVEILYTALKQ